MDELNINKIINRQLVTLEIKKKLTFTREKMTRRVRPAKNFIVDALQHE